MKKAILGLVMLAGAALAWHFQPLQAAQPEAQSDFLARKINRLILPEEPEVGGLTLEEVVEQLRVKARQAEPALPENERGVNIVLISGGETKLPSVIRLKRRDVPFAEALRYVTELAGMTFRVDPHAVVITPARDYSPQPPLKIEDAQTGKEKALFRGLSQRNVHITLWQYCDLENAFDVFHHKQAAHDDVDEDRLFINIVLHLRDHKQRAPFSMELRGCPQMEALRYIAEMFGLRLSLRSSAFVLSDHDLGPPPKVSDKLSPVEIRASKITLRLAAFQGTTLTEALDFVRVKSREADPAHQGINVITRPGGGNDPVISFDLVDIPLTDLLDHIAIQSGHRLSVEGDAFILTPTGPGGL